MSNVATAAATYYRAVFPTGKHGPLIPSIESAEELTRRIRNYPLTSSVARFEIFAAADKGKIGDLLKTVTAPQAAAVPNPASPRQMRPVSLITDRAKRYRAQRNAPPGPRRCGFCASRKNVDIDHISGDESEGEAFNLMYLCRPCNTLKGNAQKRNGIGRRTRQYNPEPGRITFPQYVDAVLILRGDRPGDMARAVAIMQATQERREEFTRIIAQARNPGPTFAQYAYAVSIHTRHAHDEGGEIIHATSPARRSEFARRIASTKRQRKASQ